MLRTGQKVVCVEEFPAKEVARWQKKGIEFPKKDEVYTIRGFRPYAIANCVWLEEIRNPDVFWAVTRETMEAAFPEAFFRPLITAEDFMGVDVREKEPA